MFDGGGAGVLKCRVLADEGTVNQEELGIKLSCFGCIYKNGGTFCRTFYSFHDDLLSENMVRRQLGG